MYQEYPPISGIDDTFIRVDPSPLVANIIGGDERTVQYNYTISMDAAQSTYDPDVPRDHNIQNEFQFVWLCRRKTYYSTLTENTTNDVETFEIWDKFYEKLKEKATDRNDETGAHETLGEGVTDHGGCFGLSTEEDLPNPGGRLNYTTGKISISTVPMYYNMEYELKVAVIKRISHGNGKYDRVQEALQTIDVREGQPPIVFTYCKVNCKRKLNPSNRYSVESQEAFGGNNFFGIYYMWDIYISVDGEWEKVPGEEWVSYSRTGQYRANFVMVPGFFQEIQKYRLMLTASRNPDYSNAGEVVIKVDVNDRPKQGNCSIWPLEGQALHTDFNISCWGWTDKDLPLTYVFKVHNMVSSSASVIHASSQPELPIPTKLTPGLPEKDYKVQLIIDVTDSLGCFTTVNLTVTVIPVNKSVGADEQLTSIRNKIDNLIESGKSDSAANLVIAVSDFLNVQSTDTNSSEATDSNDLQSRTEMRNSMAKLLSDVPVTSIGGVQQLTSAMATMTKVPGEISQQASTNMIASMELFSLLLEEDSKESVISPETLEATTSLCMEVVENIVEAEHATTDRNQNTDVGAKNMKKSEEVLDRLAASIADKMVLGQSDIMVNSSKSTLIMARSPVLWLSNKNFEVGGGNTLLLPLYEDLFQDADNGTAVSQKVIMRDRNTKIFAAGASEVNSMVVTLTLINETDKSPMEVTDTLSPIEIWITRSQKPTVNDSFADVEYPGKTAPVGGAMTVHEIDVPLHRALSLTVRSIGTDYMKEDWSYDVILYVFLRESGIPSLDVHDFNCTLRQTVTFREIDYHSTNASLGQVINVSLSNDSDTRCFFGSAALDTLNQTDSGRVLRIGINHEVVRAFSVNDNNVTGSGMPDNDDYFNPMNYTLTSSLFTCLAINEGSNEWLNKGCEVGENSTATSTQCLCNHLTTFGAGFTIPVNKIDLSDSAFLKLDENPVVFIFMVCCLSLYLLVFIWARKADKRDILMAGVTPLPDNDPRDCYHYEITVYTGLKRNAGTTANVFLLMGGELGDSAPRILRDPKRKVLQKGGVDTFLLASPVSVGNLVHIRMWHDNQGKDPAWYLNRIMIKDLQSDRTFYFMADRWLAVEEGDGMIECVIPVAGRSELTSFGHLFYSKSRRNLSDGHLWFSVFTRPVKSKFTRVQRATCCLSLLFCTMMANILFYGQNMQGIGGNQLLCRIGPISISYADIIIGVISSLIVFPINLAVVQMFRLSKPIPSCLCSRKGQARANKKFRKLSTVSGVSSTTGDLEKELARMAEKEMGGSVPSISHRLHSQATLHASSVDIENPASATNSPLGENVDKPVVSFKNTKKRKKGLELHWVFCALAWFLVVASVGVAFWLTIEIAGQFGPEKAMDWLMSMCFSLIQDIFLNQPIKVLFLAIFVSLIIRDPETDDSNDSNSALPLQEDEEWLHTRMTPQDLQDPAKVAKLKQLKDEASSNRVAPLNTEELEEARDIRIKEIKMGKIIREIVFYLIFLQITLLICFGEHDPDIFLMHKSMKDMFVDARYNGRMPFTKIRGRENFWNYTENVFIPTLYSYDWYNGDPDSKGREESFVANKNMHLVGRARFRQLRIKHDVCIIPETMINKTQDCRAPYNIPDEDDASYNVRWQAFNASDPPNYNDPTVAVWKYNGWYEISSFLYFGKHAIYNGGGYLAELGNSLEESLQIASYLRKNMWVDQYTRGLFLEFVVYNANLNMHTISFMLVEFLPQGGAMVFPYFWSIRLDRYGTPFGYFVITGQVIYTLFIFYFLLREVRNIIREKKAYFKSMWNAVELCIIILAISSMVFYLYRVFVGMELVQKWLEFPHSFLNLHYVVYWDQLYVYLSGFVLFLVTIKFLRLLRFNRRLLLFSFTLRKCSKDLAYYTIVFGVVFGAFAMLAYVLFHLHLQDFSSFVGTVETLFSAILGKFEFQEIISVNRILSPVFFFTYVIIIVFVMLSMFLSIINDTFGQVRRDNEALENELEIVEFMMERFKRWSNFSERRLMKKSAKTYNYREAIDPKDIECEELRDKLGTMVDKLNQFIRSERGLREQKAKDRKIFLCQ